MRTMFLFQVVGYPAHYETVLGYVHGNNYNEALALAQARYGQQQVRDVSRTTLADIAVRRTR